MDGVDLMDDKQFNSSPFTMGSAHGFSISSILSTASIKPYNFTFTTTFFT